MNCSGGKIEFQIEEDEVFNLKSKENKIFWRLEYGRTQTSDPISRQTMRCIYQIFRRGSNDQIIHQIFSFQRVYSLRRRRECRGQWRPTSPPRQSRKRSTPISLVCSMSARPFSPSFASTLGEDNTLYHSECRMNTYNMQKKWIGKSVHVVHYLWR